jgi:hypothetical protein
VKRVENFKSFGAVAFRQHAVVRIQAMIRAFLQRRQTECLKSNFDAEHEVKLKEKGVVELCGQYFHYKMYHNDEEMDLWLTMRPVTDPKPLAKMVQLDLSVFPETQIADLDELVEYVKEALDENCREIMVDEQGQLFDDWKEEMKLFLTEELPNNVFNEEGDDSHPQDKEQDEELSEDEEI